MENEEIIVIEGQDLELVSQLSEFELDLTRVASATVVDQA